MPAAFARVQEAKATSAYATAREKCDDQSGNAKDVCVKQAKARCVASTQSRFGKD